jgi:hypothetical protein
MSVRVALAGALALVLVAAVVLLAQSAPRAAGGNRVAELEDVVRLTAEEPYCQEPELVPADAAGLRLALGGGPGPRPAIAVAVRADGRRITSGRLPVGTPGGEAVVPLEEVKESHGGARVCLRAQGTGALVLRGSGGRASFEWRRESESWLSLLPTLAHRFGLAKANPLGSLLLPAAALLLAAAWAAAVHLVLRTVPP